MQVAIDLMVVIMTVSCLLFLKGNFRKVYINTLLTILETIIYISIIILCTIKFYIIMLLADRGSYGYTDKKFSLIFQFPLFVYYSSLLSPATYFMR